MIYLNFELINIKKMDKIIFNLNILFSFFAQKKHVDAKILEGNPKWRAKKAHLFNFYSETKIQIMQRSRLTKLKYVSTYTGTYFDERVCSC